MAEEKLLLLADLCNTVIEHNGGNPNKLLLSQKVTNILLDNIKSDPTQRDTTWRLLNDSTADDDLTETETGMFEILLQQCILKHLQGNRLHEVLSFEEGQYLQHNGLTSFLGTGDYRRLFLLCIGVAENRPECKVGELLTQIDKSLAIGAAVNVISASNREDTEMGNKNSLRVNYKALNQSCEQFAQQDQDRRHRIAELNQETLQQHEQVSAAAEPRQKPRRFERTSRLEEDLEAGEGSASDGVRNFLSMPNVNDELSLESDNDASPLRERRQTISQPIRIPGPATGKKNSQIADLTVENVELNNMQSRKDDPAPSFADDESIKSTNGIESPPNVELVKCDDIVIHFDSMQSPVMPTPATSQETTSSPYATALRDPSYFTRFLSPKHDKDPYLSVSGPSRRIGSAPPDFMADFNARRGEKVPRRNRHFSTGLDGSVPPSTGFGFFPRPQRGQSLISFLQTVHFSSSNSELERENAHFSICQAVICAIEQLKWNNRLKKFHKSRSDSQCTKSSPDCDSNLSQSSSISGDAFEEDDEGGEGCEGGGASSNDQHPSDLMSVSAVNVQPCTAYAEWAESTRETPSAEAIGLSLLAKFSDRQLPKATEIDWMVFDNQGIGASSVGRGSHGEGSGPESSLGSSFCRGTKDWAPPRAQIIFTRRRLSSRKKILEEQKYRCRGCGMHATAGHSSKFRLCGYTDQYYCTGCHRNQMSVIPARVLDEWDFKLQPVSVFAYRFLEDIWANPLFNVITINSVLYERVRSLNKARELRNACRLIRSHLLACRFFLQAEPNMFPNIPEYFTNDTDLWSMADLVAVKNGSFVNFLQHLIQQGEGHISKCELCVARGFICEVCRSDSVVYPWQLNIQQCSNCGACTHVGCSIGSCSKCDRIRQRV